MASALDRNQLFAFAKSHRQEYETLLTKAGFRMTRVVPTASAVSVVEAVPA